MASEWRAFSRGNSTLPPAIASVGAILTAFSTAVFATQPDFAVKTSFLDAISNAVSISTTGTDFQRYQRLRSGVKPGESFSPQAHASHAAAPLCAPQLTADQWKALECRLAVPAREQGRCAKEACIVLELAPFLTADKKLLDAVAAAVHAPCEFIPAPAALNAEAGLSKVHSPGMNQVSEVSSKALDCGSVRERKGQLTKNGAANYTIHF